MFDLLSRISGRSPFRSHFVNTVVAPQHRTPSGTPDRFLLAQMFS
jgi:hypothetical protein